MRLLLLLFAPAAFIAALFLEASTITAAAAEEHCCSSDITIPNVIITEPEYFPILIYQNKTVTIQGIASDAGGIRQVEALVHTFPLDPGLRYKNVQPITEGNWSHWSFKVAINNTGTYRISIRATDNAGNQNWTETLINFPFFAEPKEPDNKLKIGLVENSFTKAAYMTDGFYTFYTKHNSAQPGTLITEDLDLLTVNIPDIHSRNAGIIRSNFTAIEPSDITEANFSAIAHSISDVIPDSTITVLRDQDIHAGHIFMPADSNRNLYDIMILTHNEYTTQQEYDNLRKFVSNGGKIIFLDGNIFYAEVHYDEDKDAVTLVKGHDWEFDGTAAKKSIPERWFEETREWTGSNYWITELTTDIVFDYNPFNYTHFEEQYLSNGDNVTILIDYQARNKEPGEFVGLFEQEPRVATYEKSYGRGKIIMLGIFAERVLDNSEFIRFFENVVMLHVAGEYYEVEHDGEKMPIYWLLPDGGIIDNITIKSETKGVAVSIVSDETDGQIENSSRSLFITLPKRLIDASPTQHGSGGFQVLIDGRPSTTLYSHSYAGSETGFAIPFDGDVTEIEIRGSQVGTGQNYGLIFVLVAFGVTVIIIPAAIIAVKRKKRILSK